MKSTSAKTFSVRAGVVAAVAPVGLVPPGMQGCQRRLLGEGQAEHGAEVLGAVGAGEGLVGYGHAQVLGRPANVETQAGHTGFERAGIGPQPLHQLGGTGQQVDRGDRKRRLDCPDRSAGTAVDEEATDETRSE